MGDPPRIDEEPTLFATGAGPPCPQAQADGVPCASLDVDCLVCPKAWMRLDAVGTSDPADSVW